MLIDKAVRLLTVANLGSLRFSPQPARAANYLRDVEQIYQRYACSPLQPVDLAQLVGEDCRNLLFVPVAFVRQGSSPLRDLAALAALTRKKNPKQIFEIGTFEGLTTVVFVKNAGPDVRVHTLDLPHDRKDISRTVRSYAAHSIAGAYSSGHLIDKFDVRKQTEVLFGDSALFDFEPYRRRIDLFFVDGAHTEDYVASDSHRAFECLAPDGWVIWHDCFVPQVMKVLKQIARRTTVLQVLETNLALVVGRPAVTTWR